LKGKLKGGITRYQSEPPLFTPFLYLFSFFFSPSFISFLLLIRFLLLPLLLVLFPFISSRPLIFLYLFSFFSSSFSFYISFISSHPLLLYLFSFFLLLILSFCTKRFSSSFAIWTETGELSDEFKYYQAFAQANDVYEPEEDNVIHLSYGSSFIFDAHSANEEAFYKVLI
jgi:hypothetical protein